MSVTLMNRFLSTHPLTKDNQLSAWGRVLRWQIESRLKTEVIVPWIEGRKLAVRRGMTGATGNIYTGLHEFNDMMVPLHFLRSTDVFLDVGANVGSFTVLASGVCKATTLAFEPDPSTAVSLRRNIEINNIGALATVYEMALGDVCGTIPFSVGLDSTNHIAQPGDMNTRTVDIRTVDALDVSPSMIKMDVEGHEEAVFRGALGTLNRPELKVIETETLTPWIESVLCAAGFTHCYYDPFHRTLDVTPTSKAIGNALFIRDADYVRSRMLSSRAVRVLGHVI